MTSSRNFIARFREWMSSDLFFFAALAGIGFCFSLYIVGWRVINPLDNTWMSGDPATGYLGWRFFRREEHLTLPLGWASGIGYPLGEPIAYFDSMPLVAFFLWPLRHVFPETFQYHGMTFAAACILQLYFGYRLTFRLAPNDRLCAVLGGIIFMMAAPFVHRAFGHFALANHWLILAAVEFFLVCEKRISARHVGASAALCFVAGGINPYIAVMCLLLVAAGYARPLFDPSGQPSWRNSVARSGIGAVISIVSAVVAMVAFGFIVPGDPGIYAGGGYGFYSMNLFAPLDPGAWPSILLKSREIFDGQKFEGYNYFGFGILILALASLSRRPQLALRPFRWRHVPVWLVVVLSLFLALSLKVTIGKTIIYDISFLKKLRHLLSAFRGSGRLFWPAFYLLMTCVIGAAVLSFGRRAAFVLATAAILQFVDLRSLYAAIHQQWQESSAVAFTDEPIWQKVGRDHRHLVVVPAWQCNPHVTPGGLPGFWIFGKLAAEHAMTMNSFYAGRTSPKQIDFFCHRQPAALRHDGFKKDTAYVFLSWDIPLETTLREHFCEKVNSVILCATGLGRTGISKSLVQSLPVVPLSETITFQANGNDGILASGWSRPEGWGRWADGTEAALIFRLPQNATRPMQVSFEFAVFGASVSRPQRIEASVFLSGREKQVGSWTFDSNQKAMVSAMLPVEMLTGDFVGLRFRMPDAISPADIGVSSDARRLSIGLLAMRIDEQ